MRKSTCDMIDVLLVGYINKQHMVRQADGTIHVCEWELLVPVHKLHERVESFLNIILGACVEKFDSMFKPWGLELDVDILREICENMGCSIMCKDMMLHILAVVKQQCLNLMRLNTVAILDGSLANKISVA